MMKQEAKGEKRMYPRFPIGLTMDIYAKGHTVGKCRGSIADLSMGGMAFKSNAILEEGMCLYLKLGLPLEIRGEIRSMRGATTGGMHRYGVRFHKIGYNGFGSPKPENFVEAKVQTRVH